MILSYYYLILFQQAQKELEARVKSELQQQGEFIQAQQEAVNASNAILNDLSSALAVEK